MKRRRRRCSAPSRSATPGARVCVPTCSCSSVIAARQRRALRCRVQLDVRLRLRVRRGHRRHPRAVRQPGGADGEGACDVYLATGEHRPDADDHRPAELPAGLRCPGRAAAGARPATRPNRKPGQTRPAQPGTAIALRNKEIELAIHLPRRRRRRAVPGRRRARPPDIRRLLAGPVTGPGSAPGWGAARSCRVRGDRWSGDASGMSQRAKVYAAEEFVRTLFDRAAQHHSRAIDFFGTPLTLPPEGRFGSVEAVAALRRRGAGAARSGDRAGPMLEPLAVRARRGASPPRTTKSSTARGDRGTGRDTSGWALRELVVLHEIAHHLCRVEPAHGPEFVATFCELADVGDGPGGGPRAAGGLRQRGCAIDPIRLPWVRVTEPSAQRCRRHAQPSCCSREDDGAAGRAGGQ